MGEEDLEIVLAFNNGRHESISLSAWLASSPAMLLATNFGVPGAVPDGLPAREMPMPRR